MNALVLTLQPSRQGTPYVLYAAYFTSAEKVFLYEAYYVFYRAFALRVRLIANPEF